LFNDTYLPAPRLPQHSHTLTDSTIAKVEFTHSCPHFKVGFFDKQRPAELSAIIIIACCQHIFKQICYLKITMNKIFITTQKIDKSIDRKIDGKMREIKEKTSENKQE
jgi:hypothetical protein